MGQATNPIPTLARTILATVLWTTCFLPFAGGSAPRPTVFLACDPQSPPVQFAAAEIRAALVSQNRSLAESPWEQSAGPEHELAVMIAAGPAQVKALAERAKIVVPALEASQEYAVRVRHSNGQTRVWVFGADATGAMYGGLDMAEAIRLGTVDNLADSDHRPFVAQRGIKFNIPLDLRTPSYSDCSDSFQANIPEMWSFDFWRDSLDELARQRFNVLSLWSLHPFPSLVKVPEYPAVALDDVWRTTAPLDDTFSHSGNDMVRPGMLAQYEVVKRISIEDKIRFWRQVMQHAHDRGIAVYLFTWNTFTFGATGKYGITPALTNRTTIDYFRASVRETVLTYPLLAGIGITAGENMPVRKDGISREQWLWQTYGEGIRDALRLQTNRQFRLIHRFHMTGLNDIQREWEQYPGSFDFSFKYAIAHMYSITNPPFIRSALPQLPAGNRTWLTVRNDDIYSFRWGDPDYARAFIQNFPGPDKMAGFYMGPDGYCWGREYLSTEPETPRELVFKKQWFSFMLWGRLSFDPTLPNALFERTLAHRYPEVPAATLLQAWKSASTIFPQITRFFWGDIDLRWFPEACLSHPRHRGFYTVQHFMEGETMPGSGILNIRQWRDQQLGSASNQGVTPLEVAEALTASARETLRLLPDLQKAARQPGTPSKELRLTLGDLEAFAHLGLYYAEKVGAAADLALFDAKGRAETKESAVRHLEAALEHWRNYASVATRQYQPQLLNRVGFVNLQLLQAKVAEDVKIARNWKPGILLGKPNPAAHADQPFKP